MSLEQAIQQNTAAIERLINLLAKSMLEAEQQQLPRIINEEGVGLTLEETFVEPVPKTTKAKKSEPPPPPPAEPTYVEAAAAVTAVIKAKGNAVAKAMLAEFKVKNLKELDTDRYPAVIAAAERALA